MMRWSVHVILRWVATILVVVFLLPIIGLNVQRFAEQRGWDQFLARWWGPGVSEVASWATRNWFWGLGGLFAGASLAFWINEVLSRKRPQQATTAVPLADRAELRLHSYGDQRMPERLSHENIWRWYWLRTIFVAIRQDGTPQETVVLILFICFDRPVEVRTLDVKSPDFTLPRHEVKEFRERYAIIAFHEDMPMGTLEVSIR